MLKEFPILGPDLQKAHVVSHGVPHADAGEVRRVPQPAARRKGRATEAAAIKIALALGADEAKLREEMKNPAIGEAFAKTYDLANKLSITGTPSYVVGNEVVFGALGQDVLSEKIAEARACAQTAAC